MYTLLWSNEKEEGWDRYETEKEVKSRIKELKKDCSLEDMMIFTPRTEYLVPDISGKEIII